MPNDVRRSSVSPPPGTPAHAAWGRGGSPRASGRPELGAGERGPAEEQPSHLPNQAKRKSSKMSLGPRKKFDGLTPSPKSASGSPLHVALAGEESPDGMNEALNKNPAALVQEAEVAAKGLEAMPWRPKDGEKSQQLDLALEQVRRLRDEFSKLHSKISLLPGLDEPERTRLLQEVHKLQTGLPSVIVQKLPNELWLQIISYLKEDPDAPLEPGEFPAMGSVAALSLLSKPFHAEFLPEVQKENAMRGALHMNLSDEEQLSKFLAVIKGLREDFRTKPVGKLLEAYAAGDLNGSGSVLTDPIDFQAIGDKLSTVYGLLPEKDPGAPDGETERLFSIMLLKCGVDAMPVRLTLRLLLDPQFETQVLRAHTPSANNPNTTLLDDCAMNTLFNSIRVAHRSGAWKQLSAEAQETAKDNVERAFAAGRSVRGEGGLSRGRLGSACVLLRTDQEKLVFAEEFSRSFWSGEQSDYPPNETAQVVADLCTDLGHDTLPGALKAELASVLGDCIRALHKPLKNELAAPEGAKKEAYKTIVATLKDLRNGAISTQAQDPGFFQALTGIDKAIDCFPELGMREAASAAPKPKRGMREAASAARNTKSSEVAPAHRYLDLNDLKVLAGPILEFSSDDHVRYAGLMSRALAIEEDRMEAWDRARILFDCFPRNLNLLDANIPSWRRIACDWAQHTKGLKPDQQQQMVDSLCQSNFFHDSYRAQIASQTEPVEARDRTCHAVMNLAMPKPGAAQGPVDAARLTSEENERLLGLIDLIRQERLEPWTRLRADYCRLAVLPDTPESRTEVSQFFAPRERGSGVPLTATMLSAQAAARISLTRASGASRVDWARTWMGALARVAQHAQKHWGTAPTERQKEQWLSLVRQIVESSFSAPTMEGRVLVLRALQALLPSLDFPETHGLLETVVREFNQAGKRAVVDDTDGVPMADLTSVDSVQRAVEVFAKEFADAHVGVLLLAQDLLKAAASLPDLPGTKQAMIPRSNLRFVASALQRQLDEGRIDAQFVEEVQDAIGALRAQAEALPGARVAHPGDAGSDGAPAGPAASG